MDKTSFRGVNHTGIGGPAARKIRGVIFDFDGLILETEGPIFQSWQELYRIHSCELRFEDWAQIIGTYEDPFDPLEELEKQAGRAIDRERIEERQLRETELIHALRPLAGVEEYLADARRLGLRVGLASSSPCNWVTEHLSRLGLYEYFDCIRGQDDVRFTKPDPELYRSTLEGLGLRAEQAFALEDSPNGILAAQRAGLFCVVVPNPLTAQLPVEHADLRLESLAEMPLEDVIRKVESSGFLR